MNLKSKNRIFSTRILSEDQMDQLSKNIELDSGNFISINYIPLPQNVLKNIQNNIIITSQNAVKSILHSFDRSEINFNNIYCVGQKTKQLVDANLGVVKHYEKSAQKLAEELKKMLVHREKATFFCGNEATNEFRKTLKSKDIKIQEVPCYNTTYTPTKLNKSYEAVLFFSPSGVKSFLRLNSSKGIIAFCIGNTTKNAASKHFEKCIVSKETTVEGVIDCVNAYFEINSLDL